MQSGIICYSEDWKKDSCIWNVAMLDQRCYLFEHYLLSTVCLIWSYERASTCRLRDSWIGNGMVGNSFMNKPTKNIFVE